MNNVKFIIPGDFYVSAFQNYMKFR